MAKVFRLHDGPEGTGWFTSKPLTSDDLKTIKTGGNEVATSIPSPYARIDLVKSAFRWVTDNGIEGKTAYHQLVSDALDVAQLFFLSRKYSNKLEIIAWNPKARFKKISEQSIAVKHINFAKTLQLYWDQDSVSAEDKGNKVLYNFESVNRIYLIINKSTKQVIGGTSPATLFFAAPDARKAASGLGITSGDNVLFDNIYMSLAKREPSFIEYIYALSKQHNFSTYFPEFFSYLEKIRLNHLLSPDLVALVTNLQVTDLNNYDSCTVLNNANDPCEILNINLGLQKEDGTNEEGGIDTTSDFTILSDFHTKGKKPLILPNDRFAKKWTFTTKGILWNENNKIPTRNDKSPGESKLPIQEDDYYWLSISNFLEDKIIELPYSIDNSKFNLCGATKYLLPLTPTFFKYFKAENVSRYLKLQELAGGGVEAILEIPVKKGNIHFKKIYSQPDKEKFEVHLAIVPFLRIEKYDINYTVGIIDDSEGNTPDFIIECFESGEKISLAKPIFRNQNALIQKSYYFNTQNNFDTLRLSQGANSGIISPRWKVKERGFNTINFAIDFGTTNTHIDYKLGNNDSVALDNTPKMPFWQSLLNYNDTANDVNYLADDSKFEREIMPRVFSSDKKDLVHFPLRTALAYNKNIVPGSNLEPFMHYNYYMLYEKIQEPMYLDIRTQLKWSNYSDPRDEILVESYIRFLVLLAFYKTLILGGDPEKATITWFYTVSMDEYELGVLFRIWKKAYESIFKLEATGIRINGIPESIAPYLYYRSSIIGQSLSIDIGGGSTDIAVFDGDRAKAKLISSFKFAANAIFGDGFPSQEYSNNSDRNGFVKSFANLANEAFQNDNNSLEILSNILYKTKDSNDFSNLLFTSEANSHNTFSYTRLLESHKRMKLPIFIFYGAIAYYSANLLKRSGIDLPENILFSGTASKTAAILDTSSGFVKLAGLFKFFFEKVSQKQISIPSIKLSPIPKEITCKGALKVGVADSITNNSIKFWIGGSDSGIWGSAIDKETDILITPKYGDINQDVIQMIEISILEFYSILDDYVETVNLEGTYNIELQAYEIFKKLRDQNIQQYLKRGLKAFYKKDEKHIEETLFFYPLIGILNNLSFELSQNQS